MCSLNAAGDSTRSSAARLVAPKSAWAWKKVTFAPTTRANSTAWRTVSTASGESSSGTIRWWYMASVRYENAGGRSERPVAYDSRALHLAMGRWVVHHRVVLGAAVVPKGDAVRPPAKADLKFGDVGLADEVAQQQAGAGIRVLSIADVRRRVIVREVGRESVDEQNLLAGLGVRAHHGMLGVGELGLQREALLDRHRRAEACLDAVPRP